MTEQAISPLRRRMIEGRHRLQSSLAARDH